MQETLEQRLARQIDAVAQAIDVAVADLFPFRCYVPPHRDGTVHNAIPPELQISGAHAQAGDRFTGFDDYLWLQKEVDLPDCPDGCDLVALFDLGETGDGLNSGFESLLYLDGAPYQGVDTFHPDVVLTPYAGLRVTLTLLLWTGLNGGPSHEKRTLTLARADLCLRRRAMLRLHCRLRAMAELLPLLEGEQKAELAECAAGLLDAWDAAGAKDDDAAERACARLTAYNAAHPKQNTGIVNCIGHTHIDVAWLWRLCHTREKAMRSFSTVLRLMDEYPEYLFLQSQPQLYAFLKQDCPALYEGLRARIWERRWEADGAMWLEADCNISSGESLTRQLTHGIRFFEREFGVRCRCLWLPDVFGYSWALPQLLKLAHIDTFLTTKISWNETNPFPYDVFRWRGVDGSEVLSYFPSTPDTWYSDAMTNPHTRYNGYVDGVSIYGAWKRFRHKDVSDEVLVSYGYGDGGGGVNRDMLEMRRAFDETPGAPIVRPSFAGDFFDRLHRRVDAQPEKLPVWDGELYLEFHRGTYTTQARNKKYNRLSENRLFVAEWLNALRASTGGEDLQPALSKHWQTVLLNQFHDIIPGSSIREVYTESRAQYRALLAAVDGVIDRLCADLTEPKENAATVLNPSAFAADEPLFFPADKPGVFTDANGQTLPAQATDGGFYVQTACAPLSLQTVRFHPGETRPDGGAAFTVSADRRCAETPFYRIEWNAQGQISRLYDRENDREVLAPGEAGNLLRLYDDLPKAFDAWNLDEDYQKHFVTLTADATRVVECGEVLLRLETTYTGERCHITQQTIFYRRSRRIDFRTQVSWQESHRLLKVCFPVAVRAASANYDIQYGHVSRPTHANTSWDRAKFEVVGHKWADLSDSGYGVGLLNDCKYGYGIRGNLMTLSLLRSPKEPDETADMGEHSFTYSLLPHAGALPGSDVIPQAAALNRPLLRVDGRSADGAPIFCDNPQVQIDAVKRAEDGDGLIVRLHEAYGAQNRFRLRLSLPVREWQRCDLLEDPTEPPASGEPEGVLRPFELQTLRIRLAD